MVIGTMVQTVGSHQSSNDWPWGVTKRRLKITITATTTISDREVYIQHPPPPPHTNIRYMKRIRYTCVISLHCFYNLRTFLYWLWHQRRCDKHQTNGHSKEATLPILLSDRQKFGSIWTHLLRLTNLYFIKSRYAKELW